MNLLFAHGDTLITAPEVSVNWLAIVLATVAAIVIGGIWYGPLFGDKWLKLVGLKKKDTEKDWQKPMALMVVMSFVQAYILSHFIVYTSYFYPDLSGVTLGAITGFWAFAGFALPVTLGTNLFERRSNELSKIHLGNNLVTLVLVGVILGAFL